MDRAGISGGHEPGKRDSHQSPQTAGLGRLGVLSGDIEPSYLKGSQ
jgi:hypothetical protein